MGPLKEKQFSLRLGSQEIGSHSASSKRKRPRPAPVLGPSSEHSFGGRIHPAAAARPARGLGGPQPRACSSGSQPPVPASRRRRRVPPASAPASCGAAHPGRAGLASKRPRSARGAGHDEQGRKGRAPHRLGPPPPAEEGPSRAGSTTARASHTRRSARPPRLSPRQARRSCPRTPRRTVLPVASAPPARPLSPAPSPSCGGFAPPSSRARALPVAPTNGSSSLLHKRGGAGPRREL